MLESLPAVQSLIDRIQRPVVRLLHRRLGLSPDQVSWAALGASGLAAIAMGLGRWQLGLGWMALGQVLDGLDGAIARAFDLATPGGRRLDTRLDRASEALIFAGCAVGGLAPVRVILLALVAILLLTTIVEHSRFDPGAKRVVLYFGRWWPYGTLFAFVFWVNLTAYVIGLILADLRFQAQMDTLGGDLDTVASRAAALEAGERRAAPAS